MKLEADVTTTYGFFERCKFYLRKGICMQVIQGLVQWDVKLWVEESGKKEIQMIS